MLSKHLLVSLLDKLIKRRLINKFVIKLFNILKTTTKKSIL